MPTQLVGSDNLNVPLSLKNKLQKLAADLIKVINAYSAAQTKLTENRKINIAHLFSLLEVASKTPVLSDYKTPDALASVIYEYLSNRELFITGWPFNGSALRKEIFKVIKRDYPLIFVKSVNDQDHYKQLTTDLEKMTRALEETMTRVISYKNAILASKATLRKVNDSMDKLNVIPKIDLTSPKQDLHDAIVLQINEIGELEARLKEEEKKQEELEESIIFKSDAIKRLELQLKKARANEEAAKQELQRLNGGRNGSSNGLFPPASINRHPQSCAVEAKRQNQPSEIAMTELARR
jgi:DNA repair exonuclease SbcCD ATPase subunit